MKYITSNSFFYIHKKTFFNISHFALSNEDKFDRIVLAENNLDGSESFELVGLDSSIKPYQDISVRATKQDGSTLDIKARILLQTPIEVEYYKYGGILQYTLRQIASSKAAV